MAVLITGGAGYIGSHMTVELMDKNIDAVVIDNLSTGNRKAVLTKNFYNGDIRNSSTLDKIFKENEIEVVIHFAASSIVPESIINPQEYYDNNVNGTLELLKAMIRHDVKKIVLSSTAAVYGEAKNIPILENDATNPKSPYGETKLSIEKMLYWFSKAYGIKYASLRYFNACGAHPEGILGEVRAKETHLIPIILQFLMGKREELYIYGNDYDTPDSTCIRDYIHVTDLVKAHSAALEYLNQGGKCDVFNLGIGKGFSVLEIIKAAEKATGKKVDYKISDRRAGDPAILVASVKKAHEKLGWKAHITDPVEIISDAWRFTQKHPDGY